ncbi:MAG: hypothetical protein ACYCYM_14160 [Saccharofermentanales bacterium]
MKRKRIRSGLLSLTDILFILLDILFDGWALFLLGVLIVWANGWDRRYYLVVLGIVVSILLVARFIGWLGIKAMMWLLRKLGFEWSSIFPWLKETALTNDESKQQNGQ